MQEGLVSLMQMGEDQRRRQTTQRRGPFYLSLLTDPTMGGVTASFAMEADVILAEPGAGIGFAGARVVEQTTKKPLPKGFQKAESMLTHGLCGQHRPPREAEGGHFAAACNARRRAEPWRRRMSASALPAEPSVRRA